MGVGFGPSTAAVTRNRGALIWLGVAVTVGFGYLAVRDVDFDIARDALRDIDAWWLVPALGTFAIGIGLRSERWRALFPRETRPPWRPTLAAVLIGYFFNSVLPARAGEVARIVALHRSTRTSRVQSAASVVLERALDLVLLLLLFLASYAWLPDVSWFPEAIVVAAVMTAGMLLAAVVLVVFGTRPLHAAVRPVARVSRVSAERVDEAIENIGRGLAGLHRWRIAIAGAALTAASWIVIAASNWFVLRSFGLDLSPLAGLIVAVSTALGMALPAAPASIGVFEAATVLALAAYGVDESVALPYGVVLHLVNFIPFLVAGPIALRTVGREARVARDDRAARPPAAGG